jgi:hypothetical protein
MNRVPLVLLLWFAFWIGGGVALGRLLEIPGTFTIAGFVLGFLLLFAWPMIFPDRLQDWMDE